MFESKMNAEQHTQGVGAVVTNCQALETTLRYFLLKRDDEIFEFPKTGDKEVTANWMTNYASMNQLLREYNECLTEDETPKYVVDSSVITLRDALAHGRLLVPNEIPGTLWKFSPVRGNGKVDVEFSEILTTDWLKEKYLWVDAQRQRVFDCFRSRSYKGLS